MHTTRALPLLLVLLLSTPPLLAQSGEAPLLPESWRAVSEEGPWVVRVDFEGAARRNLLDQRADVWGLDRDKGQLVALVTEDEAQQLLAEGWNLVFDRDRTETMQSLGTPLENQGTGIPGFPCYRTVEETLATGAAIALANPGLATWTDVGDSWEKLDDASNGWDLFVLKLTQSAIPGEKPVFFANFAIHAREYATAELGTRFAEYLVNNYGTDPDVTWLLDYHEVHLMLQTNPDGRKQAETGDLWRKNTNNDYCSNSSSRGADLNRNFEYEWNCCGGSSGQQCSDVYRGPSAASEPEIQALQNYVRSIFPDQRGDAIGDPAPDDATGVAIDIHSFGELVLWPWGFTTAQTANGVAFATLGRKIAFFNDYFPLKITQFTVADGSSADFFYGDLGIAGLGFELGSDFFESCANFEANIVDENIAALLYAAKVARTPYLTPAGPEAFGAQAQPATVSPGDVVLLTASLDDTRFSNANGSEPTQTIANAQAFVDQPPWVLGATPIAMVASDGTFDTASEGVEVILDTTGFAPGRHTLFVQGTDSDGNTGIVSAVFLEVIGDSAIFDDGFESGDLSAWSSGGR